VAAPDVPAERVDYLRGVFAEVLTDPAVLEEGAKTNREIEYVVNEERRETAPFSGKTFLDADGRP